jgi:hypothetical protein
MAIRNQLVDVYRGESQTVFVDLETALGTPFDPTVPGVEVEWRMATSTKGKTLVRKSSDDGAITEASGGVSIELVAADTDFTPGFYFHQLSIFDVPSGLDYAVVMTGLFKIRPQLRMGPREQPQEVVGLTITGYAPSVD